VEAPRHVTEGLAHLKGVFLEAPETRMSVAEASRSSGLDTLLCMQFLGGLEDRRFHNRAGDGLYERRAPADD
jgi:hypothetical protein